MAPRCQPYLLSCFRLSLSLHLHVCLSFLDLCFPVNLSQNCWCNSLSPLIWADSSLDEFLICKALKNHLPHSFYLSLILVHVMISWSESFGSLAIWWNRSWVCFRFRQEIETPNFLSSSSNDVDEPNFEEFMVLVHHSSHYSWNLRTKPPLCSVYSTPYSSGYRCRHRRFIRYTLPPETQQIRIRSSRKPIATLLIPHTSFV